MIKYIINRPVLVSMFLIGLCLLGAVSYTRLPVELIPMAELPMLIVQVGTVRDADPEYVEQQSVIQLESAIAELDDIERIESYVNRRQATIIVYYQQDSDQKYAYLKLQEQVAAAKSSLGDGFFATVWKIDTEQLSNQFMTLQARGEGTLDQIREVIDQKVTRELEAVDGIASVQVYGGREHSIEVVLDEGAMRSYGITASQVSSRLSQNSGTRQYLGQVIDGRREHYVNLTSEYTSTVDLGETIVKDAGPVLLKHIAEIVDGGAEETTIARINGMEAITISLIRDQQTNLLELSDDTRDVLDRLNQEIASDGVTLSVQNDSAEVIENNIEVIKQLALVGGLLAIVILWIFLRNLPLVLVVAAAIPISVMIALNAFYAFDISINTLTLVGMAIAIGMLLDNSIVVLENIHRQMARGRDAKDAVISGTGEVGRAVIAATLTTVAVFVPFVFSDNFLVQTLGWHIGISIVTTLLVSLVVALLLIPVFSYRILKRQKKILSTVFEQVSQRNRLLQIYTLLLKSCLRFPARTVVLGVVAFFVSVLVCLAVSVNVPQEVELETFELYATMPSGTTLETADTQVKEMDGRLTEIAEVEQRVANIEEDNVVITFHLKEDWDDDSKRTLGEIKNEIVEVLDDGHPLVDFSYQQPVSNSRYRGGGGGGGGMGGGMGRAFGRMLGIGASEERVIVRGQDLTLLRAIADDIQFNIDNLESVSNSSVSVTEQQPGIDLLLDRPTMGHFDVTNTAIVAELSGFQKEQSSGVMLKRGVEEISVLLKSADTLDRSSDDLRELQIPSSSGGMIPLSQLAPMVYTAGYSNINRVNQEKQVEVIFRFGSDIEGSSELLDRARMEVDEIAADITPPPGVAIEVVHDETDMSDFYFLIFAAVLLIFMILASVFESLLTPLAMMFTLPLATIGAFWALILTGTSVFNANALIGFLILLGVVVNNGIILIDYSRLLRSRNYRPSRALLTAGQARVRPILITAITTVLAMLPLAMGKAEYVATIGAPFAITVIGGLVAGTLFTLILVPTVSFGMQNALNWWYRLNWKLKAVQFAALIGGGWLIYDRIDSFTWQAVNGTALFMVVPALTYLIQTSLRRSSATLIPAGETIRIEIHNVVKLYSDFSRFTREWRKADRQKARQNGGAEPTTAARLHNLLWQMPLYAFHFYFAYTYLESDLWICVFSIAFYAYTLKLLRPFLIGDSIHRWKKLRRVGYNLLYWFGPLANLGWYYYLWESLAGDIFIGLFWYAVVLVHYGSRKLYGNGMDLNRLTGRFKRTRKAFYRLVQKIPVIGKQRVPFKALNQVSLEIESGMFGLIGPNGAGKTTLMRVICGILDQSRGTVKINGIDLNEKREELQSLIGYLPQEFGTYENMTAYQFLDYQALLKGLWDDGERREIVERAIASVHLGESRDVKIKAFSGGMRQRVGIAQTLLHLPRILVVDEPTAGLDPRERIKFRNLLSQLARDRVVIFSTHIIEDISSSCNRLAVLGDGEVKFLGSPTEMVDLTRGNVWQVDCSEDDFEKLRQEFTVVHHMRTGDNLRVRLLSTIQPLPEAISATPTLEDSYLWLLDRKEQTNE